MNKKQAIKNLAFFLTIKTWNAETNLTGLWLIIIRFIMYFVIIPIAFFLDLAILILAISYLLIVKIIEFIFKNFLKPLLKKFATAFTTLITQLSKVLLFFAIIVILYYRFNDIKLLIINVFDKVI